MPLSTVTITGTWTRPDNTVPTGKVTFSPVQDAPGGGYIVVETAVTATLASGSISIVLVNNAQATTLQYLVTELIDGVPNVNYVITPAGSTLDLSTAPRGTLNATTPVYVLASTVGQPNGVASLDSAGKVPTSELPTSATGVLSVEAADTTITVAGTAQNPTVAAHTGITAGTVAAGNDARITGAIQSSTVTAKGDLLAATGADAVARVGVGTDGQVLVSDSSQPTGMQWNTGTGGPVFPLSGYGLVAAPDAPAFFGTPSTVMDGNVFATRVFVPPYTPFSRLAIVCQAAGVHSASSTPNKLALWNDAGTLLDSTADDPTIFSTVGWNIRALAGGTQAAQNTGRFVYIGFICGGYTTSGSYPALLFPNSAGQALLSTAPGGTRRRTTFTSGATTLPATFDPTAYGTVTNYIPFMGLMT